MTEAEKNNYKKPEMELKGKEYWAKKMGIEPARLKDSFVEIMNITSAGKKFNNAVLTTCQNRISAEDVEEFFTHFFKGINLAKEKIGPTDQSYAWGLAINYEQKEKISTSIVNNGSAGKAYCLSLSPQYIEDSISAIKNHTGHKKTEFHDDIAIVGAGAFFELDISAKKHLGVPEEITKADYAMYKYYTDQMINNPVENIKKPQSKITSAVTKELTTGHFEIIPN